MRLSAQPRSPVGCRKCQHRWRSTPGARFEACPLCGSWDVQVVGSDHSGIWWLILGFFALVACYFIEHPQTLFRLMGW
jgi:hypothetical protein